MRSTSRRPQLLNVECTVARQQPLPWQPHHGGHVGDMMGCDHSSFVSIGPLVGELWHFQYFPTWRPSAILNLKYFNISADDCPIFVLIFCCLQISSKLVHEPDAWDEYQLITEPHDRRTACWRSRCCLALGRGSVIFHIFGILGPWGQATHKAIGLAMKFGTWVDVYGQSLIFKI